MIDPAHATIGSHQLSFDDLKDEKAIEQRTRQMLSRSLNIGWTTAFIGSGVSLAYAPYPNWDALVHKAEELLKTGDDQGPPQQSGGGHLSNADRKLMRIEECEDLFVRAGGSTERFKEEIATLFDQSTNPKDGRDPLKLLIDTLRIRRFITTNYDVEIERALVRVLGCDPEQVGLARDGLNPRSGIGVTEPSDIFPSNTGHSGPTACSLMMDLANPQLLLQFGVGASGYETGVFHCHGIAKHPRSMILTERDYQRMYLQDDRPHRTYRQALELAFRANPILFVGVGMGEPDLLRPLREFVSQERESVVERPWFALVGTDEAESHQHEYRRFLYRRYGVKALFHQTGGDATGALCEELQRISLDWREWWKSWQLKPSIRSPEFPTVEGSSKRQGRTRANWRRARRRKRPKQQSADPREYDSVTVHHYNAAQKIMDTTEDADRVVAAVREAQKHGKGAIVVLGRPGKGKGELGLKLALGEIGEDLDYATRFFGTMHFTNELLSTVEEIIRILGGGTIRDDEASAGSHYPLSALDACLDHSRALIVIGGIERLLVTTSTKAAAATRLHPGGHPIEIGRPATKEVAELLRILIAKRKRGACRVVLTSSIRPVIDGASPDQILLNGVSREAFSSSAAQELQIGAEEIDTLDRLHQSLRGHCYALSVVCTAASKMPQNERAAWLDALVAQLTSRDLSRRAEIAVDSAIRAACAGEKVSAEIIIGVLQRFALFATPVRPKEIAYGWEEPAQQGQVGTAIEHLEERSLLLRVKSKGLDRYTAHTVVRQMVLRRLGRRTGETPGELSRLPLGAFSAEAASPPVFIPRTIGTYRLVGNMVDELLTGLECSDLRSLGPEDVRQGIRACAGLIRSTWSVTTMPRLAEISQLDKGEEQAYQLYQRRLVQLVNLLRRPPTGTWLAEETDDESRIANVEAPLYADELAWLYNELGLVAYSRGFVNDAYALFRVGQDINIRAERGTRGPRWCQSELNLAGVHIESANLSRARYHLENALRASSALEDIETTARVKGFLGLVRHLSGDYREASSLYNQAIRDLGEGNNRRGLSMFLRHRGDLLRHEGKNEKARRDLWESIAAAEAGGHVDLVHYARIADANWRLADGDHSGYGALLSAAEFAREVGIPKLEADALKVQSAIALRTGETELAGRLAFRTLTLAASNGMRLRVTAAMVLMGRAAVMRGDWGVAESILRSGMAMAGEQGYQLQVEEADRQLMRIRSGTRVVSPA